MVLMYGNTFFFHNYSEGSLDRLHQTITSGAGLYLLSFHFPIPSLALWACLLRLLPRPHPFTNLHVHVHVAKSDDCVLHHSSAVGKSNTNQLTRSASQSMAKMIVNEGFSYRPLKKC